MLSVYKASAGSGKTFTLAYEFIKMLLGRKPEGSEKYGIDRRSRDRHRRLLAITFTNKATDEMKRRILHELAVLAGCEPAYNTQGPYMEMLPRDLGTT
ncbi:MAG: UvrD-helicase domain-containing protein, partial [Paramuribaculum sp.]|nr:UvrD-helicase domain-containing protein [Paramuribaculum sp.]